MLLLAATSKANANIAWDLVDMPIWWEDGSWEWDPATRSSCRKHSGIMTEWLIYCLQWKNTVSIMYYVFGIILLLTKNTLLVLSNPIFSIFDPSTLSLFSFIQCSLSYRGARGNGSFCDLNITWLPQLSTLKFIAKCSKPFSISTILRTVQSIPQILSSSSSYYQGCREKASFSCPFSHVIPRIATTRVSKPCWIPSNFLAALNFLCCIFKKMSALLKSGLK